MKHKLARYNHAVNETIYNHYGLFFWQECLFCGNEFRRENGYRFQLQVNKDWQYNCGTCSHSKEEVNEQVGRLKSKRPKPPPKVI
jgi:hypothetical protein